MPFGRNIIRILTLSCDETARLLSELLDHDLPRSERVAMRLHLLVCKQCRFYRRQLEFIEAAVKRLRDRSAEPEASGISTSALSPDARARIKHSLRDV